MIEIKMYTYTIEANRIMSSNHFDTLTIPASHAIMVDAQIMTYR